MKKIFENKTHSTIHFTVIDSGIGIPKDKIEEIFREFSQVYSKKNHRYSGTGLGLTISKRLVELMGGKLELNTTLGLGSEFFFCIKFKKTSKKAELILKPRIEKQVASIKGYHILVAEDNEINAMIALKFLKSWGANAELAENGLQAVEMVKASSYDIILMDLEMPVMNGYEATKAIRGLSDSIKSAIPIVALTASAMIDVRSRITQTGMDGFILKPFKPSDLLEKIFFFANKKQ
jgi:CheY-like chemotaxis protein